jgi:hypothetical protein
MNEVSGEIDGFLKEELACVLPECSGAACLRRCLTTQAC